MILHLISSPIFQMLSVCVCARNDIEFTGIVHSTSAAAAAAGVSLVLLFAKELAGKSSPHRNMPKTTIRLAAQFEHTSNTNFFRH